MTAQILVGEGTGVHTIDALTASFTGSDRTLVLIMALRVEVDV